MSMVVKGNDMWIKDMGLISSGGGNSQGNGSGFKISQNKRE